MVINSNSAKRLQVRFKGLPAILVKILSAPRLMKLPFMCPPNVLKLLKCSTNVTSNCPLLSSHTSLASPMHFLVLLALQEVQSRRLAKSDIELVNNTRYSSIQAIEN